MADLPVYVQVCPTCDGEGETLQVYHAGCGGGTFMMRGPCPTCGAGQSDRGPGYVYKATLRPVPASVIAQITPKAAE